MNGEGQEQAAASPPPGEGAVAVGANLARIISLLVDSPPEVRVHAVPERSGTLFEVDVAEDDLGQVIGKRGRTANALRTLLDVRSSGDGRRYELEILD